MSGDNPPPIIGVSAPIQKAGALVARFAPTGLPILLVGPTGTGKELLAQHIHSRSQRRGSLVDVNCGALPRDMVESLLFGHRRGAFTGAVESTIGHLEEAHHGTLFLDEVLHLPIEGQVKLLRALETGELRRLGEGAKRRVDVRTVAAAQDDTTERLSTGAFRRDLFQRLAGVVINLPPLNERAEDIGPLATYFAAEQGQVLQAGVPDELMRHPWAGNVRELRQVIARAGWLVENGTLPVSAIREAIAIGTPQTCVSPSQGVPETAAAGTLIAMCQAHGWDIARAAAMLGVARSTLYHRLKTSGVSSRACRKAWLEFRGISFDFRRDAPTPSR